MKRLEPTHIRARLSIEIRLDLLNAEILCDRRPCWLPTCLNLYRLCCHWKRSERQRRRRGRRGGRRTGQHRRLNVPCIRGRRLMMQPMRSPGRRRRQMHRKARKSNMIVILLMHERAIWFLFYWYTKEQYDCYFKSFDDSSSNLLYLDKT